MKFTLYESGDGTSAKLKRGKTASSLTAGIVKNNIDTPMQGKVLVRLPSLGLEVWARVVATGGGSDRGFMFYPQIDDEVLVAYSQEDPRQAYVLGGLWGTKTRLPAKLPTEPVTKKIIRTGTKLTPGLAHEIEFDDLEQKVTIKTSLGQKIEMSAKGIRLEANPAMTVEMTNLPNPSLALKLAAHSITLKPQGIEITSAGTLTMKAANIEMNGVNVSVKGGKVSVNS
jgi:uncharacterized protein involved in type VI secretion and phage assembly